MSKSSRGHREKIIIQTAEQLVIRCMDAVWDSRPDYLSDIREATSEESKLGIDVVVETTKFGDINLKVKSNLSGSNKINQKVVNESVQTIIIDPFDSEQRVRFKLNRILDNSITNTNRIKLSTQERKPYIRRKRRSRNPEIINHEVSPSDSEKKKLTP